VLRPTIPIVARSSSALLLGLAALGSGGCDRGDPGDGSGLAALVDPGVSAAPAEPDSAWGYRKAAQADLDSDGEPERVVLLASAAHLGGGEFAWDTGHVWEVRVEEADGAATRAYGRWLQYGELEADVVGSGGGSAVLLVERLRESVTVYEVRYGGPGEVSVREVTSRPVEALVAPEW
jgi:hypothetical protein